MATFHHSGLGLTLVTKDDLLTRDVEKWSREIRLLREKASGKDGGGVSMYEERVLSLQAALKAEIVVEPRMSWGQVGDLPPAHTRWYSERLVELYMELIEVPKE